MIISAEYRLLIAAATPHPHPAPVPVPVPPEIDWELALSLAADHRLLGLLARHLRVTGAFVPERAAARLAAERQRIAAEELLARQQLIEAAEMLAGAGVRTVAFKGAGMIEQVYEQPGLRPMVDLDLLIAGEHVPAAVGALCAAGYRAHPLARDERRAVTRMPSSHHHHVPLLHRAQPFSIELHHRITGVCAANSTERVLDRALPSRHGTYLLPRPADHVISLAVHYINDRLFGSKRALGQLADLAHTVARYPPDWTLLATDARAYGTAARVFLALDALSTLGLATVPADALEGLAPAWPTAGFSQRLLAERVLVAAPVRSLAGQLPPLRHALLPGRRFMQDRYGLPGASIARLYLERTRTSVRTIRAGARQPARFVTDATLDRWLKHNVRR